LATKSNVASTLLLVWTGLNTYVSLSKCDSCMDSCLLLCQTTDGNVQFTNVHCIQAYENALFD